MELIEIGALVLAAMLILLAIALLIQNLRDIRRGKRSTLKDKERSSQ
jgi:hypothetical protein